MYFNENKGNTNIDSEFKSKKFDFKKLKWPLIITGGILLLIVIIILIINLSKKEKYFIILEGNENITLYQKSNYIEPGYTGYDNKGNDLTSEIIVSGTVDTSKVGEYEIIYSLKNKSVKRIINIVEKTAGFTYIYLKEGNISLSLNQQYEEPGYHASDTVDKDITDKVIVTNNIDSSKKGEYKVIYSVVNSSGITTTVIRYVTVE